MQNKFEEIIQTCDERLKLDIKTSNNYGFAKLAGVIALVVCATFLFVSAAVWMAAVTLVVLVITVVLWVLHYQLDNKIKYNKGIVLICNNHIARLNGDWTGFKDIGAEFVDAGHHYANDLDIVGAKSIFQFLNTTHTWHGRQAFVGDLLCPNYSTAQLCERQDAIRELSTDIHFANDMEFSFSQICASPLEAEIVTQLEDTKPFLLTGLQQPPVVRAGKFLSVHNIARNLICIMPVLTVVLLASGTIFNIRPLYLTGVALVVIQAAICYFARKPVGKYLGIMWRLPNKLGKYVDVIKNITNKQFSSNQLNQIKARLSTATEAMAELEKISNKLSVVANPLVYTTLNVLLLWDLYCALLLERWKTKYSHQVYEWFDAIGRFESLLSFSHLPKVCSNVCMPTLCEEGRAFDAVGMGHPLLPNAIRVCNDLKLDNNIFIISGSNMSGKTTFMRTVGVNVVLARAGSFVCASQMTCSQFDVATSMRVADDLNQGVSTFYAELKRVKLILDLATHNPNLIFLIDEIFKGTNSIDRLAGAGTVITKLVELGAVGIVSTHDLDMCKMAKLHSRVVNYSFSEEYINNEIYFDYKMRTGQSVTTNAKFLMEMVGITGF